MTGLTGNNAITGAGYRKNQPPYEIDQSLRFEDGDTPYLSWTPGSAGNRKTWTWSGWIKHSTVGSDYWENVFGAKTDANNYAYIVFEADVLRFFNYVSSSANGSTSTSAPKYRDPAAWRHVVIAWDTTQATDTNRLKIYINGEQLTLPATVSYPTLNHDGIINNNTPHYIGGQINGEFDGYLAEMHFIDGQALTPASFGDTLASTNQWLPIEYVGSYGTNGFYQKYSTPYGIEAFTSTGSHTWTCPAGVTSVEVLTVAGGGGGGNNYYGGGGGAGGVVHDATYSVTAGVVYDITVGAGGAGNNDGSDSVFNVNAEGSGVTLTAKGGGKGADSSLQNGASGGSGGGASGYGIPNTGGSSSQTSPSGATGYGNAGGVSSSSGTQSGGGGGGAGAVGGSSQSSGVTGKGGAGGAGREFTTFASYGVSGFFAGGGGGAAYPDSGSSIGGAGGQGGGGTGGKDGVAALAGTANTGSGGGGATYHDVPTGGAGGSGIVLISIDAGLGADSSSNGNNFAVTNLVATDQVIDSPTNNFCTMNPLAKASSSYNTLKEGNLHLEATGQGSAMSTFAMSSGQWYWECLVTIEPTWWPVVGFSKTTANLGHVGNQNWTGDQTGSWGYLTEDGTWYVDGGTSSSYTAVSAGDIMQFAIDMDAGKAWVGINNTWVNSGNPATGANAIVTSGLTGDITPVFSDSDGAGHDLVANFGQDSSFAGAKTAQGNGGTGEDFYYTPPTGYKALNTDNLDSPAIALPGGHFNTNLWTGTGGARSLTGVGFQPDFTWIKSRSNTYQHMLFDSVRGATKYLVSDATDAEATDATQLTAFDSDGFSLGSGSVVNGTSATFVGWNWKAGGTASSNGNGSITSSVSANTTAGFSIVNWNGTEASATVGHGLSQAPELIIVKDVDTAGRNWPTNIENITGTANQYLFLNTTAEQATSAAYWGGTPGASVFTVGDSANTNDDASMIAYCFHSVEGYSKVGSYAGNANNDGAFIYTGFRPAFVLAKSYDYVYDWPMVDNKRGSYNVITKGLAANSTDAELDNVANSVDFLSNGFKFRNSHTMFNGSHNYIYLAIAESPFKTSNAR